MRGQCGLAKMAQCLNYSNSPVGGTIISLSISLTANK